MTDPISDEALTALEAYPAIANAKAVTGLIARLRAAGKASAEWHGRLLLAEAERDALRAQVERFREAAIEARKLGMKIYHNANAHEASKGLGFDESHDRRRARRDGGEGMRDWADDAAIMLVSGGSYDAIAAALRAERGRSDASIEELAQRISADVMKMICEAVEAERAACEALLRALAKQSENSGAFALNRAAYASAARKSKETIK